MRSTDAAYTVHQGAVLRAGQRVGSVDAKGQYRVTDANGRVHTGAVAALLQQEVRRLLFRESEGPTGKLRLDRQVYEVRAGVAYLGAEKAGTVDFRGDFSLAHAGVAARGNVQRTIGAVWLGAAKLNPGSGRVETGGRVFRAIEGALFEDGLEVGWLSRDGAYRGVTREGHFFEGVLGRTAVFLLRS